jgi:hypothetical protein
MSRSTQVLVDLACQENDRAAECLQGTRPDLPSAIHRHLESLAATQPTSWIHGFVLKAEAECLEVLSGVDTIL